MGGKISEKERNGEILLKNNGNLIGAGKFL